MDIDAAVPAETATLNLATNEVIWVEGNLSLNGTTVGCEVSVTGSNVCPTANLGPSILIVNGDLTLSGGPHLYGLVYVTGDVDLSGNANFVGSLVTQGNTTNTTGSLDIYYNSAVLESLQRMGRAAGGGGSWRDF
jgi:hypothetical protein